MTGTGMSSVRHREIYRYFPSVDNECSENNKRRASTDPCLTAFAQLGALRMKAKRGYITLSTCDPNRVAYVLAESGPALSLQKCDDENDELWHGAGILEEQSGFGTRLMTMFCQPQDAPTYIFTGDINNDQRFKQFDVQNKFKFASMAIVPLKSVMNGIIIGTYAVLDENPRESISEDELQFLYDMATTVSDHLEAERLKQVQQRSERMVRALGLFIEGKSTLRDWWLKQGYRIQQANLRKSKTDERSLQLLADLEFGIQERVDYFSKHGLHELQNNNYQTSSDFSPASSAPSRSETTLTESQDFPREGRSLLPSEDEHVCAPSKKFAIPHSLLNTDASVTISSDAVETERQTSVSFDLPTPSTLQELPQNFGDSYLTCDIKRTFARASNLIRESISVQGVIYFECPSTSMASKKKESGKVNYSTSEKNIPEEQSSEDDSEKNLLGTDMTGKFCKILAYSTKTRSSLYGHREVEELQRFPVTTLYNMLEKYPNGAIFNFDDDGSLVYDIDSNSMGPNNQSDRGKVAKEIISVLPGARSVFWFPLWDQNYTRWYTGSLVWSSDPRRTFCPNEDLTYLSAFGNSTMAEVSRLSVQELSKMKTDFISSISHELRSPLHGVLASVELLQETQMNEVQIEMANNIYSSGKLLLDTINHVLDFSKVNPRAKNKKKFSKSLRKKFRAKDKSEDESNKADMCVVSEAVINTIYTGLIVSKKATSPTEKERNREQCPISIIVNIPFRQNWTYEVDKGAWRRILMNLFSNSMKYTSTGFVSVSLDVDELPIHSSGNKSSQSLLVLKVKDSGRGISEEFLKHQLYKPFTQEDTLSVGAGLGLSIVKAIVHDLKGKISFISEPGFGTEVTVCIPMKGSSTPKKVEERQIVMDVRFRCENLKAKLIGFDRYPDLGVEPTGILPLDIESIMKLRDSVEACLRDWFGIQVLTTSDKESFPDIVVIMEAGINSSIEEALDSLGLKQGNEQIIVIFLTNEYQKSLKIVENADSKIFYLHQPYGPHKIAKVLHQAYCHKVATSTTTSTNHPTSCEISQPSCLAAATQPDVNIPQPKRKTSLRTAKPHSLSSNAIVPTIKSIPTASVSLAKIPMSTAKKDLRILLVEDNEINLRLLVATMQKLKLDYVAAVNGLEALNAYKKCFGRFDVIFMDISMPIMSGIESSKHIRAFEKENNLNPVALIALTGAANEFVRKEAFNSGIDIFLTKPVPMKALRSLLDDFAII
ncbi:hypothetical protein K3495_g3586 [Podosphaera aphanis]|nr:hypothetical protein K3495_g3586 [Podosphaera aphanis]